MISAPGEGSTFWFELSLRRDGPAADRVAASGEPRSLDGRRALIVDDNATNRMILRQQLPLLGASSRSRRPTASRRSAWPPPATSRARPFDLGVLDLNMPGMDGIELAERLQGRPGDGGDDAVPAQLVGRAAGRGRVRQLGASPAA